jgi:hypothetical protein
MFLRVGFTASGKGKNRYFAGYDKMFPGALDTARGPGTWQPVGAAVAWFDTYRVSS